MINGKDTSTRLRLLAKQIEDGNAPDFILCVCDKDTVNTAHKASKPFELLGAIQYRTSLIISEIE